MSMSKKLISERIKILESQNARLIEKIERMKAQVRTNQKVLRDLKRKAGCPTFKEMTDELRAKEAELFRAGIAKRIEECLIMNGKAKPNEQGQEIPSAAE